MRIFIIILFKSIQMSMNQRLGISLLRKRDSKRLLLWPSQTLKRYKKSRSLSCHVSKVKNEGTLVRICKVLCSSDLQAKHEIKIIGCSSPFVCHVLVVEIHYKHWEKLKVGFPKQQTTTVTMRNASSTAEGGLPNPPKAGAVTLNKIWAFELQTVRLL